MVKTNIAHITIFIFDHKPIRDRVNKFYISTIVPKIPDSDNDRCRIWHDQFIWRDKFPGENIRSYPGFPSTISRITIIIPDISAYTCNNRDIGCVRQYRRINRQIADITRVDHLIPHREILPERLVKNHLTTSIRLNTNLHIKKNVPDRNTIIPDGYTTLNHLIWLIPVVHIDI